MSERDGLNDSILFGNFNSGDAEGGHHLEVELAPEEVLDGEFQEIPAKPRRSRRKLWLALVAVGVLSAAAAVGVATVPALQAFFTQPTQHDETEPSALAALAGNPFNSPSAALPESANEATDEFAKADWQRELEAADSAESSDVVTGNEEAAVDADKTSVAEADAADPAVEELAASRVVPAPQAAPVATPAPTVAQVQEPAQPAPAEAAPKAEQPAAAPAPSVQRTPAAPTREATSAPRARAASESRPNPPSRTASTPADEVIREVLVVTAAQIGLRAFTSDGLVVSSDGREARYQVNDLLPSGERITRIDPSSMVVMTDRSIIRVRN